MPSKWLQWIILGLLFFALAAAPTPAQSATGPVVIRIPVEGDQVGGQSSLTVTSQLAGQAERIIDYGSFLWVITNSSNLIDLDSAGIAYQTIDNPYTLKLGGQSFDPLEGVPDFGVDREAKSGDAAQTGPRLVQFHGPTKDAWLKDLKVAGLDIIQYIHPYTYLVWGNLDSLSRAQVQDTVRWAGDYLPAFALSQKNATLGPEPLLVRMMLFPQAGLEQTLNAVERLGGQLESVSTDADPDFDLVTFLIPGNQLTSAARLPGIYAIQPVPLDGGDRGEISTQVNVNNVDGSTIAFPGYRDWLASVGLSGESVIIANVDSGIDQSHPDLINRIIPCLGSTCGNSTSSSHGTHTAGIMVGDGASGTLNAFGFLRGLGMAPGAWLVEQVYDPTYLEADGMLTLMAQSVQNGAVISGNSWGPSIYPLGYDIDTRLVDIGVRDADPVTAGDQPLTYILSIMNGHGGTSSQGTPDEAKNIFSVGATEMLNSSGTQTGAINNLSPVTAYGPALDGRTLPMMVAPGGYVDSTLPNNSYGLKIGTSMASPQVSGAVGLFYEKYRLTHGGDPSPALVKAAFLPVAHDLVGNLGANGELLDHPFDSKQGWGRLDAAAVLDPDPDLTVVYFDQEVLFDKTGETWSYSFTSPSPITYVHAMLVWTDAPGPITIEEDPPVPVTTSAWVNNLDFSLTVNTDTYLGNNFGTDGLSTTGGVSDGMNNTEGIFLENQPAGTYTFTVTAFNIADDGVPNLGDGTDQDFALAIYISRDAFPRQATFPIFYH